MLDVRRWWKWHMHFYSKACRISDKDEKLVRDVSPFQGLSSVCDLKYKCGDPKAEKKPKIGIRLFATIKALSGRGALLPDQTSLRIVRWLTRLTIVCKIPTFLESWFYRVCQHTYLRLLSVFAGSLMQCPSSQLRSRHRTSHSHTPRQLLSCTILAKHREQSSCSSCLVQREPARSRSRRYRRQQEDW